MHIYLVITWLVFAGPPGNAGIDQYLQIPYRTVAECEADLKELRSGLLGKYPAAYLRKHKVQGGCVQNQYKYPYTLKPEDLAV